MKIKFKYLIWIDIWPSGPHFAFKGYTLNLHRECLRNFWVVASTRRIATNNRRKKQQQKHPKTDHIFGQCSTQMPECVESRVSATPETIISKLCILHPSMPIAVAIRYRIPLAVLFEWSMHV